MEDEKIVDNYLETLGFTRAIHTLTDIEKLMKAHVATFPYLVDVGFGYFCPTKPIKFEEEETEVQLGYVYRVHKDENETYALQMIHSKKWYTFYKFDLNPCYEVDFELAHFYSHKYPKAIFVNNLVASRITPECIYSLRNSTYQIIYKDKKKNITIESLEQFSQILEEDLNCSFNKNEQLRIYNEVINKSE